jgi:hypothetical protein
MSQVLGAFGLLDFITLGPPSLGARFENYEPFISFIFLVSDRGKQRITETTDTESVDTGARLYLKSPPFCDITQYTVAILTDF